MFCFLSSCFQVTGTSLLKNAINKHPIVNLKDYLPFLIQFQVICALAFIFIAALIVIKALSIGSLTLVTPLFTAINFLFTIIAGKYIFHESMSLMKISGLIIIVVGVILVAQSED